MGTPRVCLPMPGRYETLSVPLSPLRLTITGRQNNSYHANKEMKYKLTLILITTVLFLVPVRATAQELRLVPEPKQVQRREGNFTITSRTRLVINTARADEDRTAAETLAEEIEAAIGQKLKITTSKSMPRSNVIYFARIADDKRLGAVLEASKIAIDEKLNDEAYALDVNTERVIIGARTGEGVFYGAQTLRQLIHRAEANQAKVPAV